MKTNVGRTLLALGVLVLISACDKPKPAAEVDRDVAEKQSEVAKDVADARNDATSKMTSARNDARDSVQDADRKTSQAQAELLQATADDLGSAGRDASFGAGRVNALRALSSGVSAES